MMGGSMVDRKRVFVMNDSPLGDKGNLVYWMGRDHRLEDNWAFLYACQWAREVNRPLSVICNLPPRRPSFAVQSYAFMVRGILSVMDEAKKRGIPFQVFQTSDSLSLFREWFQRGALAGLVCDFSPLRAHRTERENVAKSLDLPLVEVDAHNVVPCRFISTRQEYSAYTLRRKIEKVLPQFLTPLPRMEEFLVDLGFRSLDESSVYFLGSKDLEAWANLRSPSLPPGGYVAGMARFSCFLKEKWEEYGLYRNDPTRDAQSGLSPYLHFGQIAPQTVAYGAADFAGSAPLKGGFLDELIVRRELSDNFCLNNPFYDSWEGFPHWAQKTLEDHARDSRLWIYEREEFEKGTTHDDLWNAAQHQLVNQGKIHGYMRMYWAKKILEWSPDARTAMEYAVYLNDNFALDGEDPNGYAGCAWAIGGLHDRPWGEREIFGKVRYMNRRGCERKFKVQAYIDENTPPD